jgi:hypothetical protein
MAMLWSIGTIQSLKYFLTWEILAPNRLSILRASLETLIDPGPMLRSTRSKAAFGWWCGQLSIPDKLLSKLEQYCSGFKRSKQLKLILSRIGLLANLADAYGP